MTDDLIKAIAGLITMPPEVVAQLSVHDPLLGERVRVARALCVALAQRPIDVAEVDRLGTRLLQIAGAPAAPSGRQ